MLHYIHGVQGGCAPVFGEVRASRVSNLKKCPVKRKRGSYSDLSDNILLISQLYNTLAVY